MNTFSLLLVILSVTYIFLGYKVLKADKKSLLNRLFFALNVSLVIWSFGSASYISAQDKAACIIWYKIGSVGFYFLVSIIIHFFLLFAKKKYALKKLVGIYHHLSSGHYFFLYGNNCGILRKGICEWK